MESFAGKTAVVTGAGSGIGRALALKFAAEGMNVVVADIAKADAEATAAEIAGKGGNAMAVQVDAGDRESVTALAEAARSRFGPVHVLCNNAGVVRFAPALQATGSDWDWVLNVNVGGVVNGILAFAPAMAAQGEGHIVNTGSIAGLAPNVSPGLISYTASKYAVVGLSETLREELQDSGVGVSVLCPGGVRTNIIAAGVHRQERFGGPQSAPGLPAGTPPGAAMQGMDPAQVADIVLEGIRRNDLYIITHPETRPPIEARCKAVLAAYDAAAARA